MLLVLCSIGANAEKVYTYLEKNGLTCVLDESFKLHYTLDIAIYIGSEVSFDIQVKSIKFFDDDYTVMEDYEYPTQESDSVVVTVLANGFVLLSAKAKSIEETPSLPYAVITYKIGDSEYVQNTKFDRYIEVNPTTNINNIKCIKECNKYYSLNGKLVEKPKIGNFYIYNGRKIKY